MSSYHILNAVWIGVFPMLAVSLIIGICCYIICCLNRIKIKYKEYRKRNQPNTTIRVIHRQKRLNKINHFDKKSKKEKKPHQPDKNDNINNIVQHVSSSESPSYYYYRTNEIKHEAINHLSYYKPAPINTSRSDYFEPLKESDKNAIITVNYLKTSTPNLQPTQQRTTTFNRSSLSLNLTHNHNRFEQRNNESDEEPITIKASDDEGEQIEQLIVEELKESPKSIYSRYFNQKNQQLEADTSYSPINIIDIDQSPKTSRLTYLLYSKQKNDQETVQVNVNNYNSSKKCCSSDSYERLTTNEMSSTGNRSSSISSVNETGNSSNQPSLFRNKKKITASQKRVKKLNRSKMNTTGSGSLQSQYDNKPNSSRLNSSPTRSRGSGAGSKLRLITLNKNKVSSDIDIEDDLIFNDDTDSLSSAGLADCTPVTSTKNFLNSSQKTLVNNNNNKSTIIKNKVKSNSDNEKSEKLNKNINNKGASNCLKTSYSVDNQIRLKNVSCSISDIDPDDNILNSLLVKQAPKDKS